MTKPEYFLITEDELRRDILPQYRQQILKDVRSHPMDNYHDEGAR